MRSSTSRRQSARSARGSRTSASTKQPAPTSAGWRRFRARPTPSATATCSVPNSKAQADADEYFLDNEPAHASMLRTSVSPNILGGGYRVNVIPSEAKATLDVRMLPDEDPAKFLEMVEDRDQRSDDRRPFRRPRHPAEAARGAARLGSVQDGRGERDQALQRADLADDDHGRDRHGLPACQGDAVLRRRPGDWMSRTGQRASARTAIRSGSSRASCHRFMRFHWDIVVDLARTR